MNMFATAQYPGLQQPTGYCQFVPAPFLPTQVQPQIPTFQQGEKRLLSPNAIISPTATKEDKRLRNGSGEPEDKMSTSDSEQEPTMSDLKTAMDAILARLGTTATKVDIASINDKITAQNVEIDQIKTKMVKQEEDLKKLQSLFDGTVAANLNRKPETAEGEPPMLNMAPAGPNRSENASSKQRNLIIEGLGGNTEDDMCGEFIKVCASIDVTLYRNEIEYITRYKRRADSDMKPGPVLVTITRTLLRNNILKKKRGLLQVEGMGSIFINADETLEIRRAKSMLRKVARITQQQGVNIEV